MPMHSKYMLLCSLLLDEFESLLFGVVCSLSERLHPDFCSETKTVFLPRPGSCVAVQ